MARSSPGPGWRDHTVYAPLLDAEPSALAWEWLRRDPAYRAAAADHGAVASIPPRPDRRRGMAVRPADPGATRWGLHAFEDPTIPAAAARPLWRREWLARVLVADANARAGNPAADCLDLARFADLATVVHAAGGAEHLLLSDGAASLRLDIVSGSLLHEPACLSYRLAGFAALRGPIDVLGGLLRLRQTGRLARPADRPRNRRLVLLLRAWDALRAGASQREIAAELLSEEAGRARWRSEAPSLRSRAQRLAKGARALAVPGAYRALLES